MKKVLLVLLCYVIGFTVGITLEHVELADRVTKVEETSYTQEEVDELLLELERELNDIKLFINGDLSEWSVGVHSRLEALENEEIKDVDLILTTVAMIDILVYQYEALENPTEEDTIVYDLLLLQREQLLSELESEE